MKARVDAELCAGHGQCVETCPEVFEMNGAISKVKVNPVPPSHEEACRDAMEGCPMNAILLEE